MATALPRITARVDVDTQELLAQAAAIVGMSNINSFVLSAAIEKAKQILERERSLKISQRDAKSSHRNICENNKYNCLIFNESG